MILRWCFRLWYWDGIVWCTKKIKIMISLNVLIWNKHFFNKQRGCSVLSRKNHFAHAKLPLLKGVQFSPSSFGWFWLLLQGPRALKNKCECSGKFHDLELSNKLFLFLWKWKLLFGYWEDLNTFRKFKQQHVLNFTNIIEFFQYIFSNVLQEPARSNSNFQTKIHPIDHIQ